MIMRISEMNMHPNFNMHYEYTKVEDLFSVQKVVYVGERGRSFTEDCSVEDFVERNFLNWRLRGTFINVSEMRNALLINKDNMSSRYTTSKEHILCFLQFMYNCLNFLETSFNKQNSDFTLQMMNLGNTYVDALVSNANALLFKLNADRYFDEYMQEIVVFYRDEVDDAIVNEHPDIQRSLIEYRQIDYIGNLQRKSEILTSLFKKFETFRGELKGTSFDKLQSDTGMLLNLARHAPNKNDPIAMRFDVLTDNEKEIWYDKAYKMFIACLSVLPYIDMKADVEQLKNSQ